MINSIKRRYFSKLISNIKYGTLCDHNVDSEVLGMKICYRDAREILKVPDGDFILLTVAELLPDNGHMNILKALTHLPDSLKKNMQWWIIGPHPEADFSQRFCHLLKASGIKFVMPGIKYEKDLALHFSAADTFCIIATEQNRNVKSVKTLYHTANAFGLHLIGTRFRGAESVTKVGGRIDIVSPDDCDALQRSIVAAMSGFENNGNHTEFAGCNARRR